MDYTNEDDLTPEQTKKILEERDNYKKGVLKYTKQIKDLKAENKELKSKINKLLDKLTN